MGARLSETGGVRLAVSRFGALRGKEEQGTNTKESAFVRPHTSQKNPVASAVDIGDDSMTSSNACTQGLLVSGLDAWHMAYNGPQ